MNSKIKYRADIDGLRAVAVLSVLFYHAGFKLFSGGYIGVDVFFVISGYLITTIIVREIEANEFSIITFYERRIRRIYPALYTTLAFVLAVAYFLYDPINFSQTGKSSLATIGFVSNILFWTESGYFDAPSTLKPLLHTWSLAVEEQFYILYPLLLWLIMRHARKWLRETLGALALLSFLFSLYYIKQDTSAVFYFFHLRAWELLIGGLLAVHAVPGKVAPSLRESLAVIGFILILGSMLIYTHDTVFPGASALLPTLGSALIIYSGMEGESLVGKMLSQPPFVFIGKISYSLYLWHWPMIIFGRYYLIQEPTTSQVLVMISASMVLSAFSWLVVEKPFRSKSFLPAPGIFVFAGSVMAIALAISGTIHFKNGLPGRFPPEQLTMIENSYSKWGDEKKCNKTDLDMFKVFNRCILGEGSTEPTFLLWGDSHALALAPAMEAAAQKAGATGYLASLSACLPLPGVDRLGETSCTEFNNQTLDYIKAHPEWQTIILSGRWALSATGVRYKTEEGAGVTLVDQTSSVFPNSNATIFETGLDRTIRLLLDLNRRVVIISSVPEIGYDVPSSYSIALRTGRNIDEIVAPTTNEYRQRNMIVIDVLNKMNDRYNVLIIDPATMLCNESACPVISDEQLLYQDAHHLTMFGAKYISGIFDPIFETQSHYASP